MTPRKDRLRVGSKTEEPQRRGDQLVTNETHEVIDYGGDGLASSGTALPEEYLDANAQIWVYLHLWSRIRDCEALLAVFEGFRTNPDGSFPHGELTRRLEVVSRVFLPERTRSEYGDQLGTVLVDDVQVMQDGEPLAGGGSLVRLYRVDPLPDVVPHVDLETWLLGSRAFVSHGLGVTDRKGDLVVGFDPTRENQVISKMVEGAAEIVNAVPQTGENGIGNAEDILRGLEGIGWIKRVIKSISLDLRHEAEHPDLVYSGEFPVQGLLMSLCAPHLEIYGVKIGRLRLLGVLAFRHALSSPYAERAGDRTVHTKRAQDPDPDAGRVRRQPRQAAQGSAAAVEVPKGQAVRRRADRQARGVGGTST